jgi:hypothetical protein
VTAGHAQESFARPPPPVDCNCACGAGTLLVRQVTLRPPPGWLPGGRPRPKPPAADLEALGRATTA